MNDLFNEFLQMRIEAKHVKVNTPTSIKRLQNKLKKWEDMGYNTDAIIEYAIEKQWRGLWIPPGFEPKQKHLKADIPIVNHLVEQKRVKVESPQQLQEKAQKARRQALELVRRG